MNGSAKNPLRPERVLGFPLNDLCERFELRSASQLGELTVSGVSLASDTVQKGDIFVALSGVKTHGAKYVQEAVASGAIAVLTDVHGEEMCEKLGVTVPVLSVENPRHVLGHLSAYVYNTVVAISQTLGVTGTNGKTSVVYLLEAIYRDLGFVTGFSSTAERRIGTLSVSSDLTTPEACDVHAHIATMKEAGVTCAILEVSAQALTRNRIDGVHFDTVGFTNMSHDHLDDYADMDEYFRAKQALFSSQFAKKSVINIDDKWGKKLLNECKIPCVSLSSDPDIASDWFVKIISESEDGVFFELTDRRERSLTIALPLLGRFMALNAALAFVMCLETGISFKQLRHSFHDKTLDVKIPGRVEKISAGERGPHVYIDYGHSPDAFEQALIALKKVSKGKIVMVFGADGDRDKTKRKDMGKIASRYSDLVVVTDFHPRFENPESIRKEIISGIISENPDRVFREIADPKQALRSALDGLSHDDTVLYAGPGHENYQEIKGIKFPYSAREDSKNALRERGWL